MVDISQYHNKVKYMFLHFTNYHGHNFSFQNQINDEKEQHQVIIRPYFWLFVRWKCNWNTIKYVTFVSLLRISSEYEFLKEGKKAGCGDAAKIGNTHKKTDEDNCKSKCNAEKKCTHIWHRQQNQKCILYSSCNGKSEQYSGKRFKKKPGTLIYRST